MMTLEEELVEVFSIFPDITRAIIERDLKGFKEDVLKDMTQTTSQEAGSILRVQLARAERCLVALESVSKEVKALG